MFTSFHEFTVVKLHETTGTVPDFGFDYIARGQHVEDHLHVVTGERSNNERNEDEFVPSPDVEHALT